MDFWWLACHCFWNDGIRFRSGCNSCRRMNPGRWGMPCRLRTCRYWVGRSPAVDGATVRSRRVSHAGRGSHRWCHRDRSTTSRIIHWQMSQWQVIDIMTYNSYSLQYYSFWKGKIGFGFLKHEDRFLFLGPCQFTPAVTVWQFSISTSVRDGTQ